VYSDQIFRWQLNFPASQFLFLCFEGVIRQPHAAIGKILKFIGVGGGGGGVDGGGGGGSSSSNITTTTTTTTTATTPPPAFTWELPTSNALRRPSPPDIHHTLAQFYAPYNKELAVLVPTLTEKY
jgi:hypothetical protein